MTLLSNYTFALQFLSKVNYFSAYSTLLSILNPRLLGAFPLINNKVKKPGTQATSYTFSTLLGL